MTDPSTDAVPVGDITLTEDVDGGWNWQWEMPCVAAQAGWASSQQEAEEAACRAVERWYASLT